jgi:hypothetical protein
MSDFMKSAVASFRIAARSLGIGVPAVAALAFAFQADFDQGNRRPDLPPGCEQLNPPSDQYVSFHGYAKGVQEYRFDAPTGVWIFVQPIATLYADAGFFGQIATHFAGPTWQSNSGSVVVGKKLQAATPDVTAIPWLLLAGLSSHGPGPLDLTTYVQRTNTTGGLAPTDPGTPDQIADVPYTAEYYFYRQQ